MLKAKIDLRRQIVYDPKLDPLADVSADGKILGYDPSGAYSKGKLWVLFFYRLIQLFH